MARTRVGLAESFRLDLVTRLSMTGAARQVALGRIGDIEAFAAEFGVTRSILEAAGAVAKIAMVRGGYVDGSRETMIGVMVDRVNAREVWQRSHEHAHRMGCVRITAWLRSLLHAAMLTEREPTRRSENKGDLWAPAPGVVRPRIAPEFRKLEASWRPQMPMLRTYISSGLLQALEARAQAYGTRRSTYAKLWIADLFDGFLVDLEVPVIGRGRTFRRAEEYVLPVRPSAALVGS